MRDEELVLELLVMEPPKVITEIKAMTRNQMIQFLVKENSDQEED